MRKEIQWVAVEHEHAKKGSDWFWALGIVAVSSAIVSLLFGNVLFAILIVIAAFSLALMAASGPQQHTFTLTPRGIRIDNRLFPYQSLVSFWIDETDPRGAKLIIDARQFLVPHIVASLNSTDPDAVREYLLEYLDEVAMEVPASHRLIEFFGF